MESELRAAVARLVACRDIARLDDSLAELERQLAELAFAPLRARASEPESDEDIEYYNLALQLQINNPLPIHCAGDDWSKAAALWNM